MMMRPVTARTPTYLHPDQFQSLIARPLVERIQSQHEDDELDLSLCDLESVPLDAILTYHGQTKRLNISHNMVVALSPRFVQEMSNLTSLDLSRNFLVRLPDDFGNMTGLTYLDLHLNKLQALPVSMRKLKSLQYLNISDNPLRTPLNDFLGIQTVQREGEDYKINVAHPVIKFLTEFARTAQMEAGDGNTADADVEMVMLRTAKSLARRGLLEGNSNLNDFNGNQIENKLDRRRSYVITSQPLDSEKVEAELQKPQSYRIRLLKACSYFLMLSLMTPAVVALMVDQTYFENLAKPEGLLTPLWTWYHPIHCGANDFFMGTCNMESTLMTPVPPPDRNPMTVGIESLRQMLIYVSELVWK